MLKHRLISGPIVGVFFVLVALYLPSVWAWPLLVLLAALAQLEFYTMANQAGIPVFRILGVCCGAILISTTFYGITMPEGWKSLYFWEQFVLFGTLFAVFVRQFPQKHNPKPLETIACTLFGVWYGPFLLNFFTRLAFEWDFGAPMQRLGMTGRMLVLYVIVVVKMTDVGAYFVGRALGRHKLFPRLSPAKTWEGLAGGLATAVLVSFGFWHFGNGQLGQIAFGGVDCVVLALALGGAGVVGDLFESLMKRAAGMKDSGAVVPGMGGVLDVLDSLLFAAPVMYLYVSFFKG